MTDHTSPQAYFESAGGMRFLPTGHTGGAWQPDELHIAPAIGLLVHLVEADRDRRRDDGLQLTRISCDILGTLRLAAFDVEVTVLRKGRTIELVEARIEQDGRTGVIARAWLSARYDTQTLVGSGFDPIPGPDSLPPWDPTTTWPGGLIRSLRVRRELREPGRGLAWLTSPVELLAGQPVSATARLLGLADVANGMAVRVPPAAAVFPNLDLTAHLLRAPVGEWLGLDVRASFGPSGAGLTQSVLYDTEGPVGAVAQTLTVRPGRP